jgi:hypothetical protein
VFNALLDDLILVGLCSLGVAALPRESRRRLFLSAAKISKRHPLAGAAAIGAAVIALRLCCLPVLPKPIPLIPDEHSNLLLARTLSAGRFANPMHPMWRHFEALFVLQRPAFASVYPIMQGAILAFGLTVFKEPWAGVLASIGVMCISVVWMLRAYVPRLWAIYGGMLAGAGYGVLSYWTNSYWGGAAAAAGGALAFGSLPRMLSTQRPKDAAILGLGLVILANSRPYEGFLAALPIGFCVLRDFWSRIPASGTLRRQALSLGSVLFAGALLTCWYNWRVTGSPFRLPHLIYAQQYAATPAFVWQRPHSIPAYGDRFLRDAHVSFGVDYAEYATVPGAIRNSSRKIAQIAAFYWGPLWVLVVLTIPEFVQSPRFRLVLVSLALCLSGILLTVGFQVHYAAPCTSIFLLLLVDAFRHLCRHLRRSGAVLVIALPLAWIGSQALKRDPHLANSLYRRPAVAARIRAVPGRHVVIVRYGATHPLGEEWVYDEPDIDGSQIVWARDLGQQVNAQLRRYYPERTFWLVEPDHPQPRVTRCAPECNMASDGEFR